MDRACEGGLGDWVTRDRRLREEGLGIGVRENSLFETECAKIGSAAPNCRAARQRKRDTKI
jgi:hypothetical protein